VNLIQNILAVIQLLYRRNYIYRQFPHPILPKRGHHTDQGKPNEEHRQNLAGWLAYASSVNWTSDTCPNCHWEWLPSDAAKWFHRIRSSVFITARPHSIRMTVILNTTFQSIWQLYLPWAGDKAWIMTRWEWDSPGFHLAEHTFWRLAAGPL
jgi:hypothetical protein